MENTNIESTENLNKETEVVESGTEVSGTEKTTEVIEESTEVMYSQSDLDKKVQSETDKVRTEYSKKAKELETKIKELTPIEKSDVEKDYEKRLAELEAREKAANMRDALKEKGISNDFAQFLRDDVDIEALAKVLDGMKNTSLAEYAYKPGNHKSGESMTKEEFRKLSYNEREKIYHENKALYDALR